MSLTIQTSIGPLELTRFADGSVHIAYDPNPETPAFVLTQENAAEVKNYFVASESALQGVRDSLANSILEEADRALIAAAERTTEVIP